MTALHISRGWKWFWIIVLILIIIITGVTVFVNTYVEKMFVKEIRNQINKTPLQIYSIEPGDLDLNPLTGSAGISGMKITPTDSGYYYFKNNRMPYLVDVRIGEFGFTHLDIIGLLWNEEIDLGSIEADSVEASVMFNTDYAGRDHGNQRAVGDLFTENFRIASVSSIDFNYINLKLFNQNNMENPFLDLDSLALAFTGILITDTILKKSIPIHFDEMNLNTGGVIYNRAQFYTLTTSSISLSVKDSSLVVSNLRLIPKYSRQEYNRIKDYNSDWYNISVSRINLNHFYLKEFDEARLVHLSSIEVNEPDIEIFRDKTLPDAPFKKKPLLASLLKKIPFDVLVDTINIIGQRLQYEEKVAETTPPGIVHFDPFYLSLYHVTNQPEAIEQSAWMYVDFRGQIMGATLFKAGLDIDLASPLDYFKLEGSMQTVDVDVFNPTIENLMFISFQSGELKNTSFRFTANDDKSDGVIYLFYDNLSVEVLEKESPDEKSPLLSAIAEGLVRNKNLREEEKYLVGNIAFERTKNKAITNYLWNSVKTGIIGVMAPAAAKTEKQEVKSSQHNDD